MIMRTIVLGMLVVGAVLMSWIVYTVSQEQVDAAVSIQPRRFVEQATKMSAQDPLPGHEKHQLVLILPPREDGRIWSGTLTWTASVPVEVVVLHGYDTSVQTDSAHGKPLTAPFGNGAVAITLIKPDSNTPVPSGSITFAGTALAVHTLDGTPFTVTYTVDAFAK